MNKPRLASPILNFGAIKSTVLAVLLLLAFGCNNAASSATKNGPVVGKVNPKNPLRQETAERQKADPPLILRMGEATVAQGSTVCLPVEATGITDLLGLQFTMRFDSAALQFDSFRALNLPAYASSNFGTRFAERGYLSTLWSDNSLQGVTKPADYKIFEVCFRNLLEKGQETEVKFADGPTYFEVVGTDMTPRRLVYANGKVKSK